MGKTTLFKTMLLTVLLIAGSETTWAQTQIAKWTFEGITALNTGISPVLTSGSSVADAGTQITGSSFSASHSSASTNWSTPAGNGSAQSISSTNWNVGDFYQFAASLTGYQNIKLSYDHAGSGTGPRDFKLQYSTDGSNFYDLGSSYSISTTITSDKWTKTGTPKASTISLDLSAISALNGISMGYFRIVDNSTISIGGGTVGNAGTSRIDNFIITSDLTNTNNPYSINISINDALMGSVTSSAIYTPGTLVTLIATPKTGYRFINWTEGGTQVSTNATYAFTAASNRTLVANFGSTSVSISGTTNSSSLINCSTCDVTIENGGLLTVDAVTTLNSVSISSGGKVTNNSTLTATNFNIKSDVNCTGTYIDNGTTILSGTASVQQYLSSARSWYISSPVSNAIIPTGYTIYKYDEPGNNSNLTPMGSSHYWEGITSGTLTPLTGYIAVTKSVSTITFAGSSLNTGDYSVNLTRTTGVSKEGFNLVGNPYPSYIDANTAVNSAGVLGNSIWYRTTNIAGNYVFDAVNTTSGEGTNNNQKGKVSGIVPPMQSFWVRLSSGNITGTLNFKNSQRSHASATSTGIKAPAFNSEQLLRLLVSNGTNGDETLLSFNANASNDRDAYDSPKMSNSTKTIPEIYTLAGNEELVINGMNAIAPPTQVALGFRTGENNTFSITATEVSNFPADTRIILKDNTLNIEKDITDGSSYTFSSNIETTNTRFTVIFKTSSLVTDIQKTDAGNNTLSVYKDANGNITVNCPAFVTGQSSVSMYDAMGRKLEKTTLTNKSTVLSKTYHSGIYLVSVAVNGITTTKKVVIN